jgi:hypothetical protein
MGLGNLVGETPSGMRLVVVKSKGLEAISRVQIRCLAQYLA